MELLLSMIRRCGNKAGHLSLLRNLVRELCMFKVEEKKEEAHQRGEGIGLNPNLAGWGAADGWAGYELTNHIEFTPKQPSSSRVGVSRDRIKARSWQPGPVSSWPFRNGPVGLAPVKQNMAPRKALIPKVTEQITSSKPPAPWMTVIKGKAVPLSSRAAPKPVPYPLGRLKCYVAGAYHGIVPNARPTKLRCGKTALLTGLIRLQRHPQVPMKKELEDELPRAAQLGLLLVHAQAYRPFAEQTVIDDRIVGVQYRRRPPAQSEAERLQNPERYACVVSGKDNRFVVPHNRFLALKYRSHINVEWIQGDACIKYVLKYVMKGCQLAFVQIVNEAAATTAGTVVVNYDEFRQIRMARYQTPNEALLSIWGNKIVRKSHQVQHQRFHLPGQNRIVVPVGREEERAEEERERIETEQDQHTPLTAYFTLNITIGPELAQQHTFLTICNAYWYNRQANQWKHRAQQRKNHLAMLEAASAGNPEHQALRMLLLHVRGPTSWGDLYAGHATFVEAARAMGLLEDSSIWVNTILEALSGLPTFRRRLNWTAVLFANSAILDASTVLDRVLMDSRRLLTPRAMLQHGIERVRQYVLFRMELVFRLHGVVPGNYNSCCERLGLPAPVGFVMPPEDIIEAEFNAGDYGNRMWAQLMQGDDDQNDAATDGPMTTAQYAAKDAEFIPQLNDKQRNFLAAVCASVNRRRNATLEPAQQLFMLTGDGGTGKTFAYNALIARLKSKMTCRLLATASTGIAAQLLFEGATLHSKLRVPIDIDADTMPMLDYESDPAKLLRALELLIIDEISIADKNVINYVDKLLRSIDVANNEKHFGGKVSSRKCITYQ
uniref:ATP-dependent DNA helicase n=1 Tax=Globodera pallida TaxID=36090 RepID=A0A183BLD2_GLOPA